MELKDKLNEMFDISYAEIDKRQYNPVGKWWFAVSLTLLFGAIYGVCLWGARLFYGSLLAVLVIILTLAYAFVLFRIWLAFAVDLLGKKHAESIVFIREGDKRYYYSQGRHVDKFEYERGYIAVCGNSYDKFEDKSDYSALAGRYNKSLQRRSSLYSTMTPAFWYDLIKDWDCTVSDGGVTAIGKDGRVSFICDANGKIKKIEYYGGGYYLYDSLSPIKIFDGKIPGKYRITYTFDICARKKIVLKKIFGDAMEDFLFIPPQTDWVEIERE